jgi:hypothetical protein
MTIAGLNDAVRHDPSYGRWHITRAVQALPVRADELYAVIRNYADFTPDNDPYGEHDFGTFELTGERLFWKLDYYDTALKYHSPDPANPQLTARAARYWRDIL